MKRNWSFEHAEVVTSWGIASRIVVTRRPSGVRSSHCQAPRTLPEPVADRLPNMPLALGFCHVRTAVQAVRLRDL
jgi:hypothetical protein